MPETVEVLEDLEIIQITSSGTVTQEDLLKSRQTVSKICQERGFTKILVDTTAVTSLPSTLHLYQHGSSLSNPEFPKAFKFAIVVSEAISKDAYFIETVAKNHHANLRNFESRDQALSWLKE